MTESADRQPILKVVFFKTASGREPVREWLRSLVPDARKAVGCDIKTTQYGWPLGMPLIRKLNEICGRFAPTFGRPSRA